LIRATCQVSRLKIGSHRHSLTAWRRYGQMVH